MCVVCPLTSITGVFKLVISQSAYLKGEKQGRLVHKGDWGDALPTGKGKERKNPDV